MARVTIKGMLLKWARERSGIKLADFRARFPRLEQWEREAEKPTLKQLENFARVASVPIGYLFLDDPPEEPLPIPDFRTRAGRTVGRPSPNLLETIYACQQRQDWFREYAVATGEDPVSFIGTLDANTATIDAAKVIRTKLSFDLEARRQASTWEDALRLFIAHAESVGALVMCSGVVMNNNHRRLDPDEFCGFAMVDEYAPLVFINGADGKSAQMFTLAHELAHLWIGKSALSNSTVATRDQNAIETWCNRVAAELLVPLHLVSSEVRQGERLEDTCTRMARRFKVSTLVILQRLRDARRLTWDEFDKAYHEELRRLARLKKPSKGGDFYATTGIRYSRRFARALIGSTLEGRTMFGEAYRLLGISNSDTFRELGRTLQFRL